MSNYNSYINIFYLIMLEINNILCYFYNICLVNKIKNKKNSKSKKRNRLMMHHPI